MPHTLICVLDLYAHWTIRPIYEGLLAPWGAEVEVEEEYIHPYMMVLPGYSRSQGPASPGFAGFCK